MLNEILKSISWLFVRPNCCMMDMVVTGLRLNEIKCACIISILQ